MANIPGTAKWYQDRPEDHEPRPVLATKVEMHKLVKMMQDNGVRPASQEDWVQARLGYARAVKLLTSDEARKLIGMLQPQGSDLPDPGGLY